MVWDPSLKEPRPFRVLGGFSSEPVKKVQVRLTFFFKKKDSNSIFIGKRKGQR